MEDFIYEKHNVEYNEYLMHKVVNELNIVNCPKIIDYNIEKKILKMEKINNMSISDFYGEKAENISDEIFHKIRTIIMVLYNNGIVYPDITGYNFIELDDDIWIIDFEHAHYIEEGTNDFVEKFIYGENNWNPDFL